MMQLPHAFTIVQLPTLNKKNSFGSTFDKCYQIDSLVCLSLLSTTASKILVVIHNLIELFMMWL